MEVACLEMSKGNFVLAYASSFHAGSTMKAELLAHLTHFEIARDKVCGLIMSKQILWQD